MNSISKKVPFYVEEALKDGRVLSFLNMLKTSDDETYGHSKDVAYLTAMCLEEMMDVGECEFTEEECVEITKGALLHDIGKAFLPFGIQHSSKQLDIYTQEVVKMHPLLGYIVLKESTLSDIVKNIVLYHHENADGSGYPKNMESGKDCTEDNTPPYVWIVSYADRFNAMTSIRKFKFSMAYKEAWNELNKLRINGKLPYKYAAYYHRAIRKLDIFEGDYTYEQN